MDEQRALKLEKLRRLETRNRIIGELHWAQRAVILAFLAGIQYIAALCGRRAGKTELDARIIAIALEMCGPEEWVIYAAVTRGLAKDLIWSRLVAINERHNLGWHIKDHEGLIETPRGGKFRVFGFDKLPELEKTRGYKLRCAIFDEPATYADKLDYLIRECVGPALGDLRGWLLINGTPGAVCVGFWYEASTGLRERYKTFRWTVLDNPRFPRNAQEMLDEERRENQWDEDNATYQREWLARWVNDPTAQVYKFVPDRNFIRELPEDYAERGGGWVFTLGIDFGYSPDPCAWVVLGSPRNSRDMYLVYDEQQSEMLADEAAKVTRRLVERFDPQAVVGDPAAANYIAEWNRRHADEMKCWIQPADKLEKKDAINTLNDELKASPPRFKVYEQASASKTDCWSHEAVHLPWKNERREEEHPGYPNHSLDAGLYASRKHRAYLHELPKPKPTVDEAAKLAQLERINRVQAQLRASKVYDEEY